jgi:hypothetical protein
MYNNIAPASITELQALIIYRAIKILGPILIRQPDRFLYYIEEIFEIAMSECE